MIKNIVFDMGGVLIDYNLTETLNKYFPKEYHEILTKQVFRNKLWQEMDKGTVRPDEFLKKVLPSIPVETHVLISTMIENFYPFMPEVPRMADFIKRLKKSGYKIYLLSNATPRFFDEYLNYSSLVLMDGYFISALYKLLKPQREIYSAFCDKFSLKPEECFFIDDLPQNIEGAKEFGMNGFVFDTKDSVGLEKTLNLLGVEF